MSPDVVALCGIHHVKLPVMDVEVSRDWYCRILGFEHELDFREEGRLMGVSLRIPDGRGRLALRQAPERLEGLRGFDPVAWAVPTRADLVLWAEHLDREGQPHSPIVQASIGSIIVFHDPDGYEVKLYTLEKP